MSTGDPSGKSHGQPLNCHAGPCTKTATTRSLQQKEGGETGDWGSQRVLLLWSYRAPFLSVWHSLLATLQEATKGLHGRPSTLLITVPPTHRLFYTRWVKHHHVHRPVCDPVSLLSLPRLLIREKAHFSTARENTSSSDNWKNCFFVFLGFFW